MINIFCLANHLGCIMSGYCTVRDCPRQWFGVSHRLSNCCYCVICSIIYCTFIVMHQVTDCYFHACCRLEMCKKPASYLHLYLRGLLYMQNIMSVWGLIYLVCMYILCMNVSVVTKHKEKHIKLKLSYLVASPKTPHDNEYACFFKGFTYYSLSPKCCCKLLQIYFFFTIINLR